MTSLPSSLKPIARFVLTAMVFNVLAGPSAAQDASDAATQEFLRQRLAAITRQQEAYSRDYVVAKRLEPRRAAQLQILMQENQLLLERYRARVAGQPDPTLAVIPDPAKTNGLKGLLRTSLGLNTPPSITTIAISSVAGLAGWFVGKMMFGSLGGIVGGVVGPMVANLVLSWFNGRATAATSSFDSLRDSSSPRGVSDGVAGALDRSPSSAGRYAPVQALETSSDPRSLKARMDAAYRALRDAVASQQPPQAIEARRAEFARLQSLYRGAAGEQR